MLIAFQVEEKTKFGRWYAPGQFPLPADEATARMYCAASATLQGQGMEHYEVSSYAKPGHRCANQPSKLGLVGLSTDKVPRRPGTSQCGGMTARNVSVVPEASQAK